MLNGEFRRNLKARGFGYALWQWLFPPYVGKDLPAYELANEWGLMIIVFGLPMLGLVIYTAIAS